VGKRQGCGEETVIFVDGYLTTLCAPAPEVWRMIEDLGFKIEVDYQQPVAS
jgi:biotin synthase